MEIEQIDIVTRSSKCSLKNDIGIIVSIAKLLTEMV